ncbi:MAG TPA: GNAT family N-acetyltransferase [Glycomyces sp.]|nr:GNAT family N-acetyltransferase [Glycomyces sp.]
MEIRRLDLADRDSVAAVHALREHIRAVETPELAFVPEHVFAKSLANPSPNTEFRYYTASDGGDVLGVLQVMLPTKDNAHYAEAELAVHPERRRRGIGTALLEQLLVLARDEARSELVVLARAAIDGGPSRPDAGARFLEHHGFEAALTEIDRRLDLAAVDPAVEERLWNEAVAAAEDYEVVSWIGRCPEEYLDGLGRIDSKIFAEIPLGEVDLRPRVIDRQYILAREDRAEASGNAMIRTIAVPKGSNDVAANTLIYAPEGLQHGEQAITIVDPAHRGHRLGLLTKLANLRQLREHYGRVTTLWTGNADTNANMVAINDLLGYWPVDAHVSYKRNIEV